MAPETMSLTTIVREHLALWDGQVRPMCKATGRSYYAFLVEVLAAAGRDVKVEILQSTMARIRKERGSQ